MCERCSRRSPIAIELAIGKATERPASCAFLVGDMPVMPFADRSLDLVTTGFGLRNVLNLDGAVPTCCI